MPEPKRTDGYAQRLQHAMAEGPRPLSVRGLHEALQRKELPRGTGYGGVRRYVKGTIANPRIEVLRAMADVLGVRRDWLTFNEGEMTDELQEAVERGRLLGGGGDSDQAWKSVLGTSPEAGLTYRRAVSEGLDAARPGFGSDAALIALYRAVEAHHPEGLWGEGWPQRVRLRAQQTADAVLAPLQRLGIDPDAIPHDGWVDYLLGISAVLRSVVRISSERDAGQGRLWVMGGEFVGAIGVDPESGQLVEKEPMGRAARPKPRRAVTFRQDELIPERVGRAARPKPRRAVTFRQDELIPERDEEESTEET